MNSPVHGKVGQVRETLATLDTSFWIAFHMLFCATSVDVRMISQQLLDVEALVTSSAYVDEQV